MSHAVLVLDIERLERDLLPDLVGLIREGVARLAPDAGVELTAHVGAAADRLGRAVAAEMGE